MQFQNKLVHGTLVKRYKRFFADVKLDNGTIITAHCTNTGAITSCLENGAEVFLSPVNNPKRKTKFTWEMIKIKGDWVGINTGNPNKLAFEVVSAGQISELADYTFSFLFNPQFFQYFRNMKLTDGYCLKQLMWQIDSPRY